METPLEPKKSIWKRRWKSPLLFIATLGVATFIVVFVVGLMSGLKKSDAKFLAALSFGAFGFAALIVLVAASIHWLCRPANLRKAFFGLVCLITLIALFYAEEDVRGKWAWGSFKRQWEAKGAKFEVDSFTPPAVPEDQNFALTPLMESTYGSLFDRTGHEVIPHRTNIVNRLQFDIYRDDDPNKDITNGNWAKATLTDLKSWQSYYRAPTTNKSGVLTTNEYPIAPQPQTPADDVLLALSKYDSLLEELRQASRMRYSRFPLEYQKDDPSIIYLPHLATLKPSTMFLRLRAVAELQAGQTEKAAADVKLMLYLVNAPAAEPFLISHLVRMGVLDIALQPIYEGLAEHKWSDVQLGMLDEELEKFNFLTDYELTTRGEVAFSVRMIDYIRQQRKITPFLDLMSFGGPYGHTGWDAACYVAPSGWFTQNQISISEFYLTKELPAVNRQNRQFLPAPAMDAEMHSFAPVSPYNVFKNIFVSQTRRWSNSKFLPAIKFAAAQESVDLARIAIALEHYHRAHGDYPSSLDVLAPQFIDQVPHDLIGGQPLKYRKINNNFVLYSIGWNEKDDGGVPKFTADDPRWFGGSQDLENGDWAWTYPTN
jgi:hypothetical protein